MPFKPNYGLQRADRQRAKEEKQQKKLLRRAERDARQEAASPEANGQAPPSETESPQ
jgi:hypothetical protein